MKVRLYVPADSIEWRRMRTALWPDQTEQDMRTWLARPDAATFVAERPGGGLRGFAEVGGRPFGDGCTTSPVAHLEGWYVDPDVRRQGVGAALVRSVEDWARGRGYRELTSDAAIDNDASLRAHAHLGFREVARAVLFHKPL